MAGSKSDYLENALLNHMTKKATFTPASTVWFALYNSTLTDAVTAATNGECAGSTYARINKVNSTATWTIATTGSITNKVDVQFTAAAGADWGTIKAFAVFDTSSTAAGNCYYYGDLTSDQVISSGNIVKFSTGAIVISEA